MTTQTPEEIQKLKESWLRDPCWDIEDTKGFEDHKEELLAFRKQKEAEWEDKRAARQTARREHIMNLTGIGKADPDILDALSTWGEIERALESHDRYIGDFATRESIVMAELAMAQVRATLLQASQLKRIADALESMDDGDSLIRSAQIWGSEK